MSEHFTLTLLYASLPAGARSIQQILILHIAEPLIPLN